MRTKSKYISFLFLFFFIGSYGQNEKAGIEILKKVAAFYDSQDYISYTSKYTLYLDYTTKKVHEQYAGVVLKKNKINYSRIKNTESVAFKKYSIKINHDDKEILLENKNNQNESPLSMTTYFSGFSYKLSSTKEYYICELKPGKISQVMASRIVFYINKSDYSLAKECFYFIEKLDSKDAKGKPIATTPRLEITFTPRKKEAKRDDILVNQSNYFSDQGKEIILAKRLSAYKLYKI